MGVCSFRHASGALPTGMGRYPLNGRLGGAQDMCVLVRNISQPPGFDPQTTHSFILRDIIFRSVRKILKRHYYYAMFIRPHGTIRLPLYGFSLNLIYEYFSKALWRKFKIHSNLTITSILHEYQNTFLSYLAQFF